MQIGSRVLKTGKANKVACLILVSEKPSRFLSSGVLLGENRGNSCIENITYLNIPKMLQNVRGTQKCGQSNAVRPHLPATL